MILGAIIDAKLSEMDTEQIKYTQLNEKLLQCLQLYDTLMTQEQQFSYMHQQMAGMSFQVSFLGFSRFEFIDKNVDFYCRIWTIIGPLTKAVVVMKVKPFFGSISKTPILPNFPGYSWV